jgi:ABC-type transport system involved in multi-copper enzyme maturation permease subunit
VSGALWRRQVAAILGIEIRKRLLGRGAVVLYLLAALPVLLFALRVLAVRLNGGSPDPVQDAVIYAVIYRTLVLRFVVFFGCVAIFTALFRGEVLDRSLHYYFLAPLRRSVLVAGKFLSGILAAMVLFCSVTAATWFLLYAAAGWTIAMDRLTSARGLYELGAYLLVTVLASLGYGAVFTTVGLYFKTPIAPAVAILIWEGINALLPPALKKISVIYYLESLCPVPLPTQQIAILADPAPAWLSVPGIVALAFVLLALSVRRLRRMEILYGTE